MTTTSEYFIVRPNDDGYTLFFSTDSPATVAIFDLMDQEDAGKPLFVEECCETEWSSMDLDAETAEALSNLLELIGFEKVDNVTIIDGVIRCEDCCGVGNNVEDLGLKRCATCNGEGYVAIPEGEGA